MLRQLPELELPNEFRYFGTTGRIFFLPLLLLNIRQSNLPIPTANAVYRMKYSVDLDFPRQHIIFLEESFNRVAVCKMIRNTRIHV